MSGTIGKQDSTLRKQSVTESKLLQTGVKNLKFWHEASEGDKTIPFGSLNTPTSIASAGLSNPTATAILAANLGFFKENVEVRSSLNGDLMIGLTYLVQNNQIKFVNGYEAVEGEVFEIKAQNNTVTGNTIVDARPLTATGILAAGTTDFAVGEAFRTNEYSSQQLGEVLVFVDGEIQFRNVGNEAASPTADGNYQEIHAANGYGSIIKFNETYTEDKPIIVISRNLIAERPDLSMMQFIETLGGQLDRVISRVAALAGVDESEFQTSANQLDLKAFGDKVIANKQAIASNVAAIESKQDKFDVFYQIVPLPQNELASGGTRVLTDWSLKNLELGKYYRVSVNLRTNIPSSGSDSAFINTFNGAVNIMETGEAGATGSVSNPTFFNSIVFKAVGTELTFSIAGSTSGTILGDGTTKHSWIMLEELPNHKETNKWS